MFLSFPCNISLLKQLKNVFIESLVLCCWLKWFYRAEISDRKTRLVSAPLLARFDGVQGLFRAHNVDKLQQLAVWALALN